MTQPDIKKLTEEQKQALLNEMSEAISLSRFLNKEISILNSFLKLEDIIHMESILNKIVNVFESETLDLSEFYLICAILFKSANSRKIQEIEMLLKEDENGKD